MTLDESIQAQRVGKVWQITVCDAASSYGVARILPALTARAVATFLRQVLVPAVRGAGWRVERVLTDGGGEFKASSRPPVPSWGFGTLVSSRATPGRTASSSVCNNFERPHHGYRLRGRTPATVFHGAVAAAR